MFIVACTTLVATTACSTSKQDDSSDNLGGETGQTASGGDDSDGSMTGGQGGASSGGGTNGEGGTDSEDEPNEPERIGSLQLVRALSLAGGDIYPSASFNRLEEAKWLELEGTREERCTTTEYGECAVTHCTEKMTVAPEDAPSAERLEAGIVSFHTDDGFLASGQPQGEENEYSSFTQTGPLGGGEQIEITATGGTVSAFETSMELPLAPILVAPAPPADLEGDFPIEVPASQDLILEWDRGEEAEFVQLLGADLGETEFSCRFDGPAGTGTVPAEALEHLPDLAELHLLSGRSSTVETAEGPVNVVIAIEVVHENKLGYPYFVLN